MEFNQKLRKEKMKKKLEELFKDGKELELARRIFKFVVESPFNKKGLGLTMSSIGRVMDLYCHREKTYSIISRLLDEGYFSCPEDKDFYDDDLITSSAL